ncbi:MAG: hypothetical protein E6J76_01125 [Deltaproteobacteria bacterium]|nr:MAG: hypothetical protein E6J76_01125 [Deltaproteobacteria bacterium]
MPSQAWPPWRPVVPTRRPDWTARRVTGSGVTTACSPSRFSAQARTRIVGASKARTRRCMAPSRWSGYAVLPVRREKWRAAPRRSPRPGARRCCPFPIRTVPARHPGGRRIPFLYVWRFRAHLRARPFQKASGVSEAPCRQARAARRPSRDPDPRARGRGGSNDPRRGSGPTRPPGPLPDLPARKDRRGRGSSSDTPGLRRLRVRGHSRRPCSTRLTVISEQRPKGTETDRYVDRVVGQVQRLIDAGVPPRQITVTGFSKGGAIAVLTASKLQQDAVNFVFLAACSEELLARQDVRVRGRILSVVEASDEVGRSCEPLRRSAAPGTVIEELRLATGARHGAFFQPRSAWLDPVARWAAGGTP